jgi:hypothetical protein
MLLRASLFESIDIYRVEAQARLLLSPTQINGLQRAIANEFEQLLHCDAQLRGSLIGLHQHIWIADRKRKLLQQTARNAKFGRSKLTHACTPASVEETSGSVARRTLIAPSAVTSTPMGLLPSAAIALKRRRRSDGLNRH